jgi:hypothetical protein
MLGWVLAALVLIALAAIIAYYAMAGGYRSPATPYSTSVPAPASGAPAAPIRTSAPAPAAPAAPGVPAPPRYP